MGSLVLPLVLLAAFQVPVPPPPPPPAPTPAAVMPRDAARDAAPRTGTGIIRGKVTDQESGQPIVRAIVMVTSAVLMQQTQGRALSVITTADGQYELKNLPAGEYTVTARPGEFRATHLNQGFGDDRPPDFSRVRRPRPLSLADGEVRENVNIALWRTAAVEGRVVDEFGEPLAGIDVFAKNPENGQRAGMSGPYSAMTDDRGQFRVYGIAPGRYNICAVPRNFGGPAQPELKDRAIQTCHPAAVIDADAAVVTVSGGDVGGIEIRLQRSRAFTVSGMALDAAGAPLDRANINIVRMDQSGGASTGIEMRGGGRFVARGVTPGEYTIRAEIGSRFNPEDKREREMGYVPFRVESSDIEGLLVTTSKLPTVSGRVVFEDEAGNRPPSTMRVSAMPDASNRMYMSVGGPPNAEVKSDLTFELAGLFGPQVINLFPPRDWVVKAVTFKGLDITDTPTDFAGSRAADTLEIVLTNRGARVSGRVTDEQGQPSFDARVVVMPADPAKWKRNTTSGMGGALPKPDGSYQTQLIRPGEYLIVAIGADDMIRGPLDSDSYERLAKHGQRITLVENDRLTLDLRVTKLP